MPAAKLCTHRAAQIEAGLQTWPKGWFNILSCDDEARRFCSMAVGRFVKPVNRTTRRDESARTSTKHRRQIATTPAPCHHQ
eukprot:scaffold72374_cov45-Prasinocladus_malaysianus.AAC.1